MQIVERLTIRIAGRKDRTAPARRGAVIPAAVFFLSTAMADAAPAREAFNTLVVPGMSSDHFMRPEIEKRGGLARFLDIPQIGIGRQSASQARLLESESRAWKTLLDTMRIDRLPCSVTRSLRDLGQSGADGLTPSTRGRSRLVTKRRIDTATVAWQISQIALERIAIPQPRPSSDSVEARTAPLLSFIGWPDDLSFGGRTLSGMTALSLAEKAVYDAIAELPPEKEHDFHPAVSAVLQRVETAYDLSADSVILIQPTFEVQDVHSHEPQTVLPNGLVEDAVSEIRTHGDDLSDLTLWRYPDPASISEASRPEPDAITSVDWRGERAGAILVAGPRRRARNGRKDAAGRYAASGHHHQGTWPAGSNVRRQGRARRQPGARLQQPVDAKSWAMRRWPRMPSIPVPRRAPRIQSAGERAKQVLDQMLSFSRRPENACDSFDVATATADILADLKTCLPASATFRARLADGPVCIHGSATALQQAVINLCKNAGEALADRGTVTVGVKVINQSAPRVITHGQLAAGRYVRVNVTDTGPGIPSADLQQISDPFFTTHRRGRHEAQAGNGTTNRQTPERRILCVAAGFGNAARPVFPQPKRNEHRHANQAADTLPCFATRSTYSIWRSVSGISSPCNETAGGE